MTKIPNLSLISDKSYVSESPNSESKWYAVYTRSRFEKKLYQNLQRAKIQAFLPLIKEKRKWSDRVKSIQVPLLPSYVFVKLPVQHLQQVYYYPGVVRVLKFEGKPCEIREAEIGLLEHISKYGAGIKSNTLTCRIGDAVQIVRGPLQGWEGKVEHTLGQSRVVFQFESLQQCISVEVSVEDLEKIT
jgi:transcription antitermination factor NusG